MNTGVFQRHEVKYLVTPGQRSYMERVMQETMIPDSHGESTIINVYYDTPDFRLIRRSLEKPDYKEKLRIRSYGTAAPDEPIFLELKKKYNGIVFKRRIEVPEKDAMAFLAGLAPLPDDSQIGHEIKYFVSYYGNLKPAVHLSYDRSAFFSKDDPDLRITFDRNIRWNDETLSLTAAPHGKNILQETESLMEIKAASAMPLWLTRALSDANIRQISFSKYGLAYKTGIEPHLSTAQSVRARSAHSIESRGFVYV